MPETDVEARTPSAKERKKRRARARLIRNALRLKVVGSREEAEKLDDAALRALCRTKWGGARPNSGPRAAKPAAADHPKKAERRPLDPRDLAAILSRLDNRPNRRRQARGSNPFVLPAFPPAVLPKEEKVRMAMDNGTWGWGGVQWAGAAASLVISEGITFLGYPFLAELTQRPEYRVISETIGTEMTRKWGKFKGTGNDEKADAKAARIKELEAEFERLQVRDAFKELAVQDGFFGRSHLFLNLGDDEMNAPELTSDIGDGFDATSKTKVQKGSLKSLKVIEAVWTYPTTYNALNPLQKDWYNPQIWYVMGTPIHCSRLLTFIGRPVPDLLKPAYAFGGMSLSQMAKPVVDIWLQTRQSVGDLIHAFSVMVLSTDMQANLQPQGADGLIARVAMFNTFRDNEGAFVINKDTEDFKNVAVPLSGLHELKAQAQENIMSIARIPAVKYTGLQPTGLNASSEGEIRAFYDTIGAYQNSFFRPNLNRVMRLAMLNLWGEVDPEITFEFEPLWEMSAKERADIRKLNAETAQVHIDSGVIHPEEDRRRIANDPEELYAGIEVDDVPDLREEEEAGLEPIGGRPQPVAIEDFDEERDPDQ